MQHAIDNAAINSPMLKRVYFYLVITNIVGVLAYLFFASWSWAIPGEEGLNSMSGEPFIWALGALPILMIFFLLDVAWGLLFIFRKRAAGNLYAYVIVGLMWLAAITLDFSRHPYS